MAPDVQEGILNAAAGVFAEEGYHHASISDICRKANISNGALYKYFKNKEALFFAVLDRSVQLVEIQVYRKYFKEVNNLYGSLRFFLQGLAQHAEEFRDYVAIYCDLGSSSMNRFAAVSSEKYRNATSIYTVRVVEAAKKQGEIDARIHTEVAAYLIDSYITLFAYAIVSEYQNRRFDSFFAHGGKSLNVEQQIDIIIDSLRQTLNKSDLRQIKGANDRSFSSA